jgi:hypothetical protein
MLKKCQSERLKFLAYGDEIHIFFFKLRKIWLATNDVILEYIDVLSLICTKYAKEMSIRASEIFSVFKEDIHIFRS